MAALLPLAQDIYNDRTGNHFMVSVVRHNGGSNTVDVGERIVSVASLAGIGETAPTTTGSGTTVTLSGGSTADIYVITRHAGNAAGL